MKVQGAVLVKEKMSVRETGNLRRQTGAFVEKGVRVLPPPPGRQNAVIQIGDPGDPGIDLGDLVLDLVSETVSGFGIESGHLMKILAKVSSVAHQSGAGRPVGRMVGHRLPMVEKTGQIPGQSLGLGMEVVGIDLSQRGTGRFPEAESRLLADRLVFQKVIDHAPDPARVDPGSHHAWMAPVRDMLLENDAFPGVSGRVDIREIVAGRLEGRLVGLNPGLPDVHDPDNARHCFPPGSSGPNLAPGRNHGGSRARRPDLAARAVGSPSFRLERNFPQDLLDHQGGLPGQDKIDGRELGEMGEETAKSRLFSGRDVEFLCGQT